MAEDNDGPPMSKEEQLLLWQQVKREQQQQQQQQQGRAPSSSSTPFSNTNAARTQSSAWSAQTRTPAPPVKQQQPPTPPVPTATSFSWTSTPTSKPQQDYPAWAADNKPAKSAPSPPTQSSNGNVNGWHIKTSPTPSPASTSSTPASKAGNDWTTIAKPSIILDGWHAPPPVSQWKPSTASPPVTPPSPPSSPSVVSVPSSSASSTAAAEGPPPFRAPRLDRTDPKIWSGGKIKASSTDRPRDNWAALAVPATLAKPSELNKKPSPTAGIPSWQLEQWQLDQERQRRNQIEPTSPFPRSTQMQPMPALLSLPPVPRSPAPPVKSGSPWNEVKSKPLNAKPAPKILTHISQERRAALEKLKMLTYSKQLVPAKYYWPALLTDASVFHDIGIELVYTPPADVEILKLLDFEPSRSKLPDLVKLANDKSSQELAAFRADSHLIEAVNFVWASTRLTAREAQALATSIEHAMLYELVNGFAQVPRIREQIISKLSELRVRVGELNRDIGNKVDRGVVGSWDNMVLVNDKATNLLDRYDSGQGVRAIGKLPKETDRSLGIDSFVMLSMR